MSDLIKRVEKFRIKHSVSKYLLQGSLFPVTKNIKDNAKKEALIKTYNGRELLVTHNGFTQFDLAVSLAYKKIINRHHNFEDIQFTVADFAHALNRADGGKTRLLIFEAFKRSNSFHLCFDFGKNHSFDGYRLNSFKEETSNVFRASFNMNYLSVAYHEEDTCNIDIDVFLSLQLGLQSWLYGFICSEPNQSMVSLDEVHLFSGSNYKNSSDFKKAVKEALSALYKKGIIEWKHGVTRDGIVFWQYKNPFDEKNIGHIYHDSADR